MEHALSVKNILFQADFYLTNMLAAIDKDGLLDDLPEDNTNMKDPLQDLKSVGMNLYYMLKRRHTNCNLCFD